MIIATEANTITVLHFPTNTVMPPVLPDVAPTATASGSLHVVFSAECIPAFDWQSVGLFYSFYRVKQPGKITRLLACSEEQLKTYPKTNLEMGPTFVHRNMRFDHANDAEREDPFHDQKGRGYASYNKPYSVTAWLEERVVEEEWILMMDTDMFFRAPIDPVSLGVRRGNVVSAGNRAASLCTLCGRAWWAHHICCCRHPYAPRRVHLSIRDEVRLRTSLS